jgi:hypothetical protein
MCIAGDWEPYRRWAEVEKLKNEITALESGLRAAQKRAREAREALVRSEHECRRMQAEITSLTIGKQVISPHTIIVAFCSTQRTANYPVCPTAQ